MLRKKLSAWLKLVLFGCLALVLTGLWLPSAWAESPPFGAATLQIDGSEEMLAINQQLKQRYQQQFPETTIELNTSGTEAALKRLLQAEIDLVAIGRSLTVAEKAQGFNEIPVSREQIAIVVSQENPFAGDLSIEQLQQIFSGKMTDWSELGRSPGAIQIIDRPVNSDTRLSLKQYPAFRNLDLIPANLTRLQQDDTTELIQALGRDGIGYAIAAQLSDQDAARIVKLVIQLDVSPDRYAYASNLYPYSQVRGYAYKSAPGDGVQAFLGFVTTKPGQAAVAAAKLTEAEAVATGKSLIAPIVKVLPSESPTSLVTPESDGLRSRWVLLLAIAAVVALLGLFLWRLIRSRSGARKPAAVPQPKASAKSATASSVSSEPDLKTDFELDDFESPQAESAKVVATALTDSSAAKDSSAHQESSAQTSDAVSTQIREVDATIDLNKLADRYTNQNQKVNGSTNVDAADRSNLKIQAVNDLTQPDSVSNAVDDVAPVESIEAGVMETTVIEETGIEETGIAATVIEAELVSADDIDTPIDQIISAELIEIANPSIELPESPFQLPDGPLFEPLSKSDSVDVTESIELPTFTLTLPDSNDPEVMALKQAFLEALHQQNQTLEAASLLDCYQTLATLLCGRLLELNTPDRLIQVQPRLVGEISAEFLPGPHLENNLINLGLLPAAHRAMQDLGLDLTQIFEQEEDPGLGRGGLGRLMVCYLDALATANVAAIGYGLRYEYGLFDQQIQDGWQVEVSDTWLRHGNPWEVARSDHAVEVKFGGYTEAYLDEQDRYRVRWMPAEVVTGMPYDTLIPGYRTQTANLMRLWRAESGNLSQLLYPVDSELAGKELRLQQQFFLVSCAIQDAMRLHLAAGGQPYTLADRFALQINDTDPALAILELMRLLVDEKAIAWEQAWRITQHSFAYTNHSLMPEALDDRWSVGIFGHFLPRHLEILYEINYRLLETVKTHYPNDEGRLSRMSLIDESGDRYLRLSALACVGSHAVNGVSDLHTRLLEQTILRDFYEMYPQKFSNQSNGVTPRRFLLQTNPALADLISRTIGTNWITNLDALKQLEPLAEDAEFRQQWRLIKQMAKRQLAAQIQNQLGLTIDPQSLFDVQAMVIHEYKRPHLNLLHLLTLYNRLKANPKLDIPSRTFIFAGKAAPDYFIAKLMIKLIHAVADLVNSDSEIQGRLKVVFWPDFNLKSAQPLYAAIDLAEHLSMAGTEAGDTGNMIAVMNGGLMIGSPDGSNLEIRAAIGAENSFQFGQPVVEVLEKRARGYNPLQIYQTNLELKAAIDLLTSGRLAKDDSEQFRPIVNLLLYYDQYMLLADYAAYLACQQQVSNAYQDVDCWTRMSILATAHSGKFSADRAVRDYCEQIWQIEPIATPEYNATKQ